MLEELGCDTLTARNGTEALAQLVKDKSIDILISDIEMERSRMLLVSKPDAYGDQ
jgi:CheY-like chemotaxis protein